MQTKANQYLSQLWLKADKKITIRIAVICLLIFFGDTLLPMIWHLVHLFIEVVESILEHFLESFFQLSARQAQLLIFWAILVSTIYGAWRICCKAYFSTCRFCAYTKIKWQAKINGYKNEGIKMLVLVTAMSTTLLLLS